VPLTTMEKLSNGISEAIDISANELRISPQRREKLKRELLTFLILGVCGDDLRGFTLRDPSVNPLLKKLLNTIGESNKLPQALRSCYQRAITKKQALREWKVKPRDWDHVHRLVDYDQIEMIRELTKLPEYELPWLSEIEHKYEDLFINLDSRALEDILISVLETYKVPKGKGAPFSEVYGLCLGMTKEKPVYKRGLASHTERYVHIVRAAPQIRAELKPTSCKVNPKSWDALLETAKELFPHYEVVGEFHSHPYTSLGNLTKNKGWEPSKMDREAVPPDVYYMQTRNHQILVHFIVSIAKGKESSPVGTPRGKENVLRFYIGRCHVFIAAYRTLSDGRLEHRRVRLRCPTVTGLGYKH